MTYFFQVFLFINFIQLCLYIYIYKHKCIFHMPSKMKDNFNQLFFFSWGAQIIFLNLIIQYFLIICAIYSAKNKGLKAIFQLVFSSGTSMTLLKISDTLRVPVKLASPSVYMWASLVAHMVKNLPAMEKTYVQSLSQEDPLEKGMATHSCIFTWRIPWTEEPGSLQSMGLQRVGHDWATNTSTSTCT